jgi:MFS superfamily sulfate permease-like transporter
VRGLSEFNPWALGVGLLSLAIILGLRMVSPRIPGILIAVVVAIALSIAFDLAARGVSVIGVLPQGFPSPSFPAVDAADLAILLAGAAGIALVSIGDTISVSGGFAARTGREVGGNQELAGIGTANIAAGLFSGFPVSTSASRTAVATQAGSRTQLTGLVAAALVLLMLVFVPGLVQAMPQPVLAAVVIAASLSLVDIAELRRLYRVRGEDFGMAIACAVAVALIGVLEGIVIAIVLSLLFIFRRAWSPYWTILGKPDGVPGFHDVRRHPGAAREPGLIIVRWSAPLFFANANIFRDAIRTIVADADEKPKWIMIAAEPITDIDTTAGTMLRDLDLELNASGIRLAFAELQSDVADSIVRYGLLETIDQGHLYPSVTEGVKGFRRETGADPSA